MSGWNAAFTASPPDQGENPGYIASRLRDTKDEIELVFNQEHILAASDYGDSPPTQNQHRTGSALAYSQSAEPTTKPPSGTGAALGDVDAGRLWHDTDTNGFKVYVDTTDEWVDLFEATDIDDASVAPTDTLASLQDKIDALAYQVRKIIGGDSTADPSEDVWTTAPATNLATVDDQSGTWTVLEQTATYTQLDTWLDSLKAYSGTGYTYDFIPLSGAFYRPDASDQVVIVGYAQYVTDKWYLYGIQLDPRFTGTVVSRTSYAVDASLGSTEVSLCGRL